MISRIWYSPWWPLTDRCAAFHAVITGSISAHRSSVKSLGYRLRSLTRPPKHGQARRPAVTPQIHSITQRQHGHKLANSPLRPSSPKAAGQVLLRSAHPDLLSQTEEHELAPR